MNLLEFIKPLLFEQCKSANQSVHFMMLFQRRLQFTQTITGDVWKHCSGNTALD